MGVSHLQRAEHVRGYLVEEAREGRLGACAQRRGGSRSCEDRGGVKGGGVKGGGGRDGGRRWLRERRWPPVVEGEVVCAT